MSPKIISDPHEKFPLSSKELNECNFTNLISKIELLGVGSDDLTVRFSMLENGSNGTVSIEILESDGSYETAGNVNYTKINIEGSCLENGVQISSAYFSTDYRGFSLGTRTYEMIARKYLLISDNTQTHDGAAFWKYGIGDNDKLEVQIVINPTNNQTKPYKMIDSDGNPTIYHYSKEELEPMIWGLELPSDDSKHPSINASKTNSREDIVLIVLHCKPSFND
jgi:hypothetical protein